LALIKYSPEIIRERVKPMEQISDIKILPVNGLNGGGHSSSAESVSGAEGSLADQVVNSALRYRAQAVTRLLAQRNWHQR